uniref:hypothetical protein n=1 Tax=Falsiroseomonas oryzae TaxID=2766473 RepID=UPI0022EA8C4E
PSAGDLLLNVAGAIGGAVTAAFVAPRRARGALDLRPRIAEAFPAVLLGCWLAYRLYPYVPSIDLAEWKNSLKPLLPPWDPDPLRTLRIALMWLVAARLLDAARPGGERGLVFAALLLAVTGAAVPIVGRNLTAEEVIAAGLALPAWLLLGRRRWTDPVLLAVLLAAVVLEGARPYRLLDAPRPFGWIPLRSLMAGQWGNGLQAMLYKTFMYGGVAWLGLKAGLRLPLAGALALLLAAGISVLQTWLPGRSAEITDAALAAGAVFALALLARRPPESPRSEA